MTSRPTTDGVPRVPHRAWSRTRRVVRRVARFRPSPSQEVAGASCRFLEPIPPRAPSNPPGPTIVLLNDCRDQVNFGAEVLVDGLIHIIHDRVPDATLVPIPSHWLIDTTYGLDGFADGGKGLRQPSVRYPSVADQFEAIADDWLQGAGGRDADEVLRRFDGASLVVLNGEGSIYRTNLSAIRELFLAWLAKDRLKIPTVFVNGGIHLTDVMPVLPAMVRKTLPRLDAIAVREPRSLRNLREYVPGVDARLFPDSAFVFTPAVARRSEAVAAVHRRIGGSPYFCFDPGPMPMDARRGGRSALYRLIAALKGDDLQAVLVCSAPADEFIEAIADETDSLYVDTITDYREFMALVSDAQFLVSGRYHNPILAAIMGCPTITLASTNHKVHGACEMLDGALGMPYDGTSLLPDLDAIVDHARGYVLHRDEWSDRLRRICERRRLEVMGLGDLVKDVLRSHA